VAHSSRVLAGGPFKPAFGLSGHVQIPSTPSSRPEQIIAKAMIRGVERPCVSWGREVFPQEHFVLAALYVQLRACPVGVYGQAFPDFRKMFSATKKAGHPERPGGWPTLLDVRENYHH
jgi:hypothetical protein